MGKRIEAKYLSQEFRIEEDSPEVGVYLYVFEGKKCIKDFLQNTINDCKEFAFEQYSVPISSWKESPK